MPQSAFVSKNEKSIRVDGFSEEIIIRPLSATEKGKATHRSSLAGRTTTTKSNSDAAEFGIVSIGGEKHPNWSRVLHSGLIAAIGKEIWDITS